MATSNPMKVTVVLNSSGQVAGASKQTPYSPAHVGDEQVLTFGQEVGSGQTLLEVEIPAHVGALDGEEFLSQLAGHASVKAAGENLIALLHSNSATQSESISWGKV